MLLNISNHLTRTTAVTSPTSHEVILIKIHLKLFNYYYFTCLDHTHPVSNIKGIKILAKTNITFLQSSRGDKCVDLITFNLVELLNGSLDLAFVGLDVNNENKGIAVLDKLH